MPDRQIALVIETLARRAGGISAIADRGRSRTLEAIKLAAMALDIAPAPLQCQCASRRMRRPFRRWAATSKPASAMSRRCSAPPTPARPTSPSSACSATTAGMIGLPLRLLAREVYDKIAARVGADNVALVTGEEKIKPESAALLGVHGRGDAARRRCRLPRHRRGAARRRSRARARLHRSPAACARPLGDAAARRRRPCARRSAISCPAPTSSRARACRSSPTPGRRRSRACRSASAVVAFSAAEVYAIAELIRRQRGGAAVVLGALSPRTRNAQVALYQSGDVDFLVATDAIGMGLNLDVDHVAFSAARKFDGQAFRNLTPAELGQIAGRAGRHMNDGTLRRHRRRRAVRCRPHRAAGDAQLRQRARAAVAQPHPRLLLRSSACARALRETAARASA